MIGQKNHGVTLKPSWKQIHQRSSYCMYCPERDCLYKNINIEVKLGMWFMASAKVTKDKERFTMETGDSVIIEKNQLHRLENSGDIPLQIIEVQTGSYFGEDDIIRLEDSYGRADLH